MSERSAPASGYHSPLRQAQAAATRQLILDAVAALIERGAEPTFAAIAEVAEIQERTIYRHFPSKDELSSAFWQSMHAQRIGTTSDASDLPSLLRLIRESFDGFSEHEPFVRAMLHSPHGRAIRLNANDERRRRFERVAASELPGFEAAVQHQAAAAAQVLSSAMSWEYLHDYWGLDAQAAASAVHQAITAMFHGLRAQLSKQPPAPAVVPPGSFENPHASEDEP